ncbi:MAG: hypothetical protein K1X28_05930 [Parachlamydiales bacterium]|nr:hypothetical protein [Parachlamydiales bacterium]
MANAIGDGALVLQQWHRARAELAQARSQLLEEQNQHAVTKEKLVDGEAYRTYAKAHIADLETSVELIRNRLRDEERIKADLQDQLRQKQGAMNALMDQLLLRDHNVVDIQAQIAIRDRLIVELQQEIDSIVRLKNRAIRIRDLVIEILTLALEIERENTTKAATVSTTLTAELFICPPLAIATGVGLLALGAMKGNLHNARQAEMQKQMNQLQDQLELVKRSR